MLQNRSHVRIIDSSGGYLGRCIKILAGFRNRIGFSGDLLLIVVLRYKHAIKKRRINKGKLYLSILITNTKEHNRNYGSVVQFFENRVIILNKDFVPIAKRMNSIISINVRMKGFSRILIMSEGII